MYNFVISHRASRWRGAAARYVAAQCPLYTTSQSVYEKKRDASGNEDARAADRLDLLLRQLGELLGLDDDGLLRELALAKHLEDTLVKSGRGGLG